MFRIEKQFLARLTAMCAILIILCPLFAWGTIGIAETHSQLYYNQFATIHWIHPGDGCDSGKYCFYIEKKDGKYIRFQDITCSFQKINVPADNTNPLIFAQCCMDKHWLVYNLKTEKYLIQTDNYAAALNVWKSNRLKEPDFADAHDEAKGLYKTWSSRFEEWIWMAFLFLPLFVIAALPLFTFLSVWFAKKFKRTRQFKHLLFFIFLLIPSLLLWFLVIRFFGFR